MKISLIGPYALPYGGISVHIKRQKEALEKQCIKYTVFDISGVPKKEPGVVMMKSMSKWLSSQFFSENKDIIHYHGYSPILIIALSLLAVIKQRRIVITFHSFRYETESMNLQDKLAFWLAKKARIYFIAVGVEIKQKIISLGIEPKNVEVIPSFIPPVIEEDEIADIPQEVWNFIKSHSPIISANAFRISFYNNQDLYGIDMCVDLCANLKQSYPNIGFVFCLSDIGDFNYFNKMKQRIVEKEIEGNFLLQSKPCQFYPIIMKSDVFVRPTNTDGDAVSLREALYFKVPSIGSSVVPRPEGTILFRSRDIDDFTSKVKGVIDNYEEHKKSLEIVKMEDNAEKIVKIYQRLTR